ncbi:Glycogen synthase [Carpediemonas membranifera]|uniref:Glycogen [starch] synthase n=1 Tax=Carpediemonas membranifera TaxID=201153 RepID=A0A8J6B2H1_9EUKA|nr:Glycogen synthase [Carpediemonas membranifera]|eukprot:KAG9392824.1 Glycogen synthase [Carpediemonas membranifera]
MSPILFDVSLEVAHKVGGIYTVLKSKTPFFVENYGDNMVLLGPYIPKDAAFEFEDLPYSQLGPAIEKMQSERGVAIHYGRWLVEGNPRVVLFDLMYPAAFTPTIDRYRRILRERFNVGFGEFKDHNAFQWDAFVFGCMVAEFLDYVRREVFTPTNTPDIVVHFHEWLSAVGLLLLKENTRLDPAKYSPPYATCFTTHATVVGRYLCAGNQDFYRAIQYVDADREAGNRGCWTEHAVEKSAARECDVFTTVSEVTATEAQHILGRKPDVVTLNGLPPTNLSLLHHLQLEHQQSKTNITKFIQGHFSGALKDVDPDKVVYMFSAGRYEFINKGIDVTLEALAALNRRLIQEGSDVTVFFFLIFPAKTRNYHVDTLRGMSVQQEILETAEDIGKSVSQQIAEAMTRGREVDTSAFISPKEGVKLRRLAAQMQRSEFPPVVTHQLVDDSNDAILCKIRELGLFNSFGDRVKVIFHPEFVSSASPLFKMDYTDFVRGCHVGCFPSYYEPFGYTPAECMQAGVVSITSNVSGFGRFIEGLEERLQAERPTPADENFWRTTRTGVNVVDREYIPADQTVQRIANTLFQYTQLSRRERVELRSKTERASLNVGWDVVGEKYLEAHELALANVAKRM